MAQLKSTVVQGNLSVTDTTYTTNLNLVSATASKAILTDANKNLVSGTVPVNTGGTGGTSFTANSVIMSGSSTTAAFTTRAITNNTSATAVTASTNLITANTLYYHIGNSNITTLGTITIGTWNATVINPNKGGTGVNSYAKGDILYAGAAIANTATTALSKLTIGSSGQVLQTTSSGIPGWITATDANTASTIVKRDSSGNFSAGTITAALSGNADSATVLYTGAPTSSTSGDIAGAIQAYWNANKSTIIRNKGLAFCSTHSTVSMSFGYFLSGYDSTPYGGFFSALYNTPYYIGVNNGTFTQQTILTSSNYSSWALPVSLTNITEGTAVGTENMFILTGDSNPTATTSIYKRKAQNVMVGYARFLENRGGTGTSTGASSWTIQATPDSQTNQDIVWRQKWTKTGLTYTPSGGSATTLTDGADTVLWLSNSSTANTLQLNIQIDGMFLALDRIQSNKYLSAGTGVYINSGDLQMKYNNTWYSTVKNHNNGNITFNAAGAIAYLGYQNTTSLNFMNGKGTMDASGNTAISGTLTMSNYITLVANKYAMDAYGLNANNSNIVGINQLRFNDTADTYNEGIMFPNGTGYDCMAASGGTFHFRSATDGSPSLSLANSIAGIACGTINSGSVIIKQPSTARNQGIFGTYDYSRAAVIWGMGTGYNIAADGSGLGSFYGAAYGYQGQAYLGSNNYAGGHQLLWCQNGAVYVALGNTIWTSTQVIAGTFAANTAQSAEADIVAQSGAGKIYLYSTAATTGNRGIWALNAAGTSASIMALDQSNNIVFGQNVYYNTGQIIIRHGTSPMSRILFGTLAQTNTYTMASQDEWGDIFYFAPAKNNSANTWFDAGFIFRQYSYTASSTTRLSYYEDYYLPRVTTGLSSSPSYNVLTSKGFVGINSSWNTARNNAQLRMTAIYTGGYSPILSVKTTNGSWEMGEYDNANFSNYLLFTYVTDTQYSTSGANYTAQLRLSPAGYAIYTKGGETAYQAYNSTSGVNVSLMAGSSGLGGLYVNGYSTTGASGTFTSNAGWIIARDNQNHNSIYGTICPRSGVSHSLFWGKGTSQTSVNGYFGLYWTDKGANYSDNRFRALYYSYNSSTFARLSTYEYYDLPAVTANLGTSVGYSIITTKNASDLFRVVGWTCSYTISANSDIHLAQSDFGITTQTAQNKGVDPTYWQPVAFTRIATSSSNLIVSTFWASCAQPGTGAAGSGTYASNSTVVVIRNVSSTAYGPSNTRTCTIYLLYIRKTASNVGYLYSNV